MCVYVLGANRGDGYFFISYNWSNQPIVLKIRDKMKEVGFRIWIDVENMCQSQQLLTLLDRQTVLTIIEHF